MSVPQPTDRFSKKAARTGSILIKDHPPDKKPKSDKAVVPVSHEFDPTGLVQRCVIIQKDESGFGLTVSGDNPVFVQLVKEDGAAMRAGVQTGDRIIKVNGTLVTHSNHVEVVKLIKSGDYVALTVLGRPPGLPQIPLSEGESEPGSPPSPELTTGDCSPSPSPTECVTTICPVWDGIGVLHGQKVETLHKMPHDLQAIKQEYSRHPTPKLLKEIEETRKCGLQPQLSKTTGVGQDGVVERDVAGGRTEEVVSALPWLNDASKDGPWNDNTEPPKSPSPAFLESPSQRKTYCQSPKTSMRSSLSSFPSPDGEEPPDLDSLSSMSSPFSRHPPPIIGAEDDDFDSEQEQVNGQCSCFQSMELLKSRPAHLAAFIHHVVSQFDPAPLLCYLYADLYKQTNSKDTRRLFAEMHSFFMDKTANLKVAVPESISAELERRRQEPIPEEMCRQHIQQLQDSLLPDIQRNLEDFRQKRNMGLTMAEMELTRLDTDRVTGRVALEKERSCAEHIIIKIEEVLLTPTEEDKCSTMQYVIYMYMKHLGVKVKEPKTKRMPFLRIKKPRFTSILVPPRRPSRTDVISIGKAMENKPRQQKPLPAGVCEHTEPGRVRTSDSSETSHDGTFATSPPYSSTTPQSVDLDPGDTQPSALPRLTEALPTGESPESSGNHFDFSTCPLEHMQEEEPDVDRNQDSGTPKLSRRIDALGPAEVQSEDDQSNEVELEQDPPNWQTGVPRDVLTALSPQEIKRQEVINELFYTERAHLRMLKVLDSVFYQKLSRETILPLVDIKHIFSNLEEIVQLHVSITDQMAAVRKKNESSVIDLMGDDLLAWFSGVEEEKVKQAVGTFCSNQPFALELIKSRQKKDQRFAAFIQEAESNRLCRRLQLKDIIPVEMQRLTKYPLLLENIAKCTENTEEKEKVRRAGECCRKILNHVNQAVKEAENKQRLEDYQRRLDLSSLKQSENTMIAEFKNLDLTKRKMVHEGPLSWKVNRDKTIELYTLLLEDILVLLQRQDERLVLKCHSKNLAGTADTKHIFSPIIKLSTVLVRSVATDNKSFFVLSMSDNGAQIYELMAQTVSEQRTWQCLITQMADSMKMKPHNIIPLPETDGEQEAVEMLTTTGVSKLNKDPDRSLTGIIQSPIFSASSQSTPPPGSNPFESSKSEDEEEEEGADQGREEEGEMSDGSVKKELPHTIDSEEAKDFTFSSSRAEEALRTLAALRHVLVDKLIGREENRSSIWRSTALHSEVRNGAGGSNTPAGAAAELPSGGARIFEDCGSYMVLGSEAGESSTDDDLHGGEINMRKLLSSSQTEGGPDLSRQIMTHLRLLQANLHYLKEVEAECMQLRQRLAKAATDMEGNKEKSS
ncbi:rho guanine nucleotide exchange factor 12 isoform X2 [Denticeps clupeoides]|uniref:rho guanine nucleotide exchange factor 12 isoform X2 n=1 Tax=Denticeps clupeoides TaxID=299321 RepID=UPI0010A49149|nr:rho guanine nucleotide exchange factor 12 isoform X2 [Denticeps clupeoides]